MKNTFFILLFCLNSITLCAQTMEEKYSLDFRDFSWLNNEETVQNHIDSSYTINNKHPLKVTLQKTPTVFKLQQDIVLPVNNNKSYIRICLNSKCENIHNMYLKATCYDNKKNIISEDSININKNIWGSSTLSIMAKNTKTVNIAIIGNGKPLTEAEEQAFWADRIEIKIDGENFNNFIAKEN